MSPLIHHIHSNATELKLNLTYNLYWSGIVNGYDTQPSQSDWMPVIIIPVLATVILAASIFLLIIFRQNPTFVITTVTGCLIFITVYLVLSALESTRQTFE